MTPMASSTVIMVHCLQSHSRVRIFLLSVDQDQNVGDLVQINNCVWRGAEKPITSLWIGKSVELEISLFTVCFRTRLNQNCNIEVNGGNAMTIVNYDYSGTDYVGTAYPEC